MVETINNLKTPVADVQIERLPTCFHLRPLTHKGTAWIHAHNAQRVEPRDIDRITDLMSADGLTVG